MKKFKYSIALLGLLFITASCEKDNYDEPDSFLSGTIMYNGEPVRVGYNEVGFELWQPGFGLLTPIGVAIDQDGSYSARLYDGDYKLKFIPGQGPFRIPEVNAQQGDTILVNLRGDQQLDIEVEPYYMIRNVQFSQSGGTVSASCSLEQIITGDDERTIERITLYLNDGQFVSDNGDANVARGDADISDLSSVSVSLGVPQLNPPRDYVYARIGVKIAGVEDMLYSQVEELSL
ncbi:DUF3823 domain-containing protein [Robertkochia solimangrovi]|uniref:DUF3823 domain-containing protein n=1 Tax=Robertkochia solimangrovi TaxID=2213046 RepID=UPI00118135BA|nr:DUF3823 domain-containing protein [Robertkochia solimangrovi]TRZ42050.1 hypothetical protein DMZ48_15570 [Robertkochia solimangrovi]